MDTTTNEIECVYCDADVTNSPDAVHYMRDTYACDDWCARNAWEDERDSARAERDDDR